jgi:hypothetical protein
MTIEVLESRKQLEIKLKWMQDAIPQHLTKMEELRAEEALIDKYREKAKSNRNFEMTVTESKLMNIPVDNLSALNCRNCETTCHYPCDPSLPINWCNVFVTPERGIFHYIANSLLAIDVHCRVCPGKCKSSDHAHESRRWTYKEVTVMKTLHDVRRKYENAKRKKYEAKETAENLREEVDELEERISATMNCVIELHNKLAIISLCDNPLTNPEYIQMMIENERQNSKRGYGERIGSLNKFLALAQLTEKIVEAMRFASRFTYHGSKQGLDFLIGNFH